MRGGPDSNADARLPGWYLTMPAALYPLIENLLAQ